MDGIFCIGSKGNSAIILKYTKTSSVRVLNENSKEREGAAIRDVKVIETDLKTTEP